MLPQPLLDILEPVYHPCAHFEGACAGGCVWNPAKGLVPCAFGGALGSLDEVRLIIVTAEPGDPPDSTGYHGTPQDMVQNSVRIFREAMQKGGIDRVGRPTPFHRNMRRILDAFWPTDGLDVQLRKTWTTNAVLCADKVASWESTARLFRGETLDGRISAPALPPRQDRSHRVKRGAMTPRPELTSDLQAAISTLPPGVADFFRRLVDHPDYGCQAGRMQLMVSFRGAKVGGLNRQASHWYFSKVFIRDHGDPATMTEYSFRHVVKDERHEYWMRQGAGAQAAFVEAMVAMNGVRP